MFWRRKKPPGAQSLQEDALPARSHASGLAIHDGGGQAAHGDLADLFTDLDALQARDQARRTRFRRIK